MTDYQKYINALRKCAKEHENDITSFGHIIVSDLCRDTAKLLEELNNASSVDVVPRKIIEDAIDSVEDYVCNKEKDTTKAQGMCDAITMIEDYMRRNEDGNIE